MTSTHPDCDKAKGAFATIVVRSQVSQMSVHTVCIICLYSFLRGYRCWCCLQKVCIAVPGVRPLPQTELGRRQRAVELIRSGTSESFASCRRHPPLCHVLQCVYAVLPVL